jgi:putative endonuclease
MFVVYAIANGDDHIYIGQTIDIENRLKEHNSIGPEYVGRFTEGKGPWRFIYTEKCEDRSSALKRERQLKSYRGRIFIKSLLKK